MNLIDQKLKDKLTIFDNIDKDIERNSFKIKKRQLNNSQSSSNIRIEQFNNIYSNFIIENKNYQKNNNILLKTSSNNHTLKNTINTIKKTTSETSYSGRTLKNISKSKNLNNSNSNLNINIPNDSGKRLYNYGFYLKNKLEKRRKKEEEKINSEITPKMMNGIPNNNYNNNSNISENLKKKERNLYNSQYTYRPILNKNSLKIAKNLGSSTERLIRKKKKNSLNKENKNYYNNIYIDSSRSKSNSTSPSNYNKNQIKKCTDLYNKGVEQILKREKVYKESKLRKEEEYKKYSFKPKLNSYSKEINNTNHLFSKSNSKGKSNNKINDIYKKQRDWKKKLDNINLKKKEEKYNEEIKDCTFKPEISHLNIQNEEKFILKNLQQMNDYVIKRRDIIKKQKEYEKYKNKRLGNYSKDFIIKTTVPKEFEFKTKSRSNSKDKINNKENIHAYSNINDDNGLSFFNHSGNILTQKDFINAINQLHSRIDNLDI